MAVTGYLLLKGIHAGCALTSITLFIWRGLLWRRDPQSIRRGVLRWLPHLVDTLLLASALGLVTLGARNPLAEPWLAAKITALLGYIGLGLVAFRGGRRWAWYAAVALFAYIVAVAVTKDPLVLPTLSRRLA
ncbi:MAG: regulator SirB [Gammaproteobacteria bacterium]|nr:MAG: regulator SirB [Gammaproteobacteria bacterium]